MNAAAKLAAFAAVLGALFVAGAAAGGATNPDAPGARSHPQEQTPVDHGKGEGAHGAVRTAPLILEVNSQ